MSYPLRGVVWIALWFIVFPFSANDVSFAQTIARREIATVEGKVIDALTGVAVVNHPVHLEHPEGEIAATTDGMGRFSISTHLTGHCRVAVVKGNGYLRSSHRLEISPGETLRGIQLKLTKGALIGGRVTDSTGAPVPEGIVNLRLEGRSQGRRTVIGSWTRALDRTGRFRFEELSAGRYILSVMPKPIEFREMQHSELAGDPPEPRVVDAITYYPNSPTRVGAAAIALDVGQVNDSLEVTLIRSYGVCLTTALPSYGDDLVGLTLSEAYPLSQSRVALGRFRPGTPVRACGLTPGEYRLTAFTNGQDGKLAVAVENIAIVGRRSVTIPQLSPEPFRQLTGSVIVSASDPDRVRAALGSATMSVVLEPKDRLPWAGELLSGVVSAEGHFGVPAVLLDDYWVTVSGFAERHYVKTVRSGAREAYAAPLRVGSGDVTIEIGTDGPILTGTVRERSGSPVADATVILRSASVGSGQAPNQVQTARTGSDGQFAMRGMPPGYYVVAAFRGLTPFQEGTETILEIARTAGIPVALTPNATKHVVLDGIEAPRL